MVAVFKGDMDVKDLETKDGKDKVKKMFKEQLALNKKQ
jgi:hypothetical protein